MVTETPGPDAAGTAPAAAPVAPPVVAVVVAHDPGPWFEETVAAVAEQDYPNLSVLVVDAASGEAVRPRVGQAAPGAFVRRIEHNDGFGAAANEVLEVVEGAAFYLLCHDDVAPEPDVVRLLVEEAFRSNAAVVGPKLVEWDAPRTLLQVGQTIDRAGFVAPLAERGELDQGQHDAVRDVFVIPGACTLVRADLFSAIGGFDEAIDYHYDDVSLCWRARVAGGRVIVAPAARVRHLEALGVRRPVDDRRRLQARHRLRTILTCTSAPGLVRALPRLVLLNALELAYVLLVGRAGHARDLTSSWMWNLRRLGELRVARREVRTFRRVSEREIRQAMVPGSSRFSQFVRGQIGRSEDRLSGLARTSRDMAGAVRSGTLRTAAMVWAAVAIVLLAGSRHLLTRGVPAVGELVPFTSTPFELLRSWASGWRPTGLGSESPAPTGLGMVGAVGTTMAGAMALLRTILTVGLIPLGGLGAYRLARPSGSRYGQIGALLLYLAVPLPYNALAQGRWGALALYAAAPTLLCLLARASGRSPFGRIAGDQGPGVLPQPLWVLILGIGLVSALAGTVAPVTVLVVPLMAASLALGSLLVYRTRGSGRLLLAGAAGGAVAFALHLPWSLDYVLPGSSWTAITGAAPGDGPSDLASVLRFELGPLGAAPLGWAVLAVAALPLLIGKGERLGWAVRGWTMAVVFWGLAWAAQRGDLLPVELPHPSVLLAPAAAGLALSTSMGVSAFLVDLPGYRFGWRQIASGLAAAALAVAAVPVLGAAFDGRWSMPAGDHARTLGFVDADNDGRPFRVLWLGDPRALPLGAWQLGPGLAYATTDHGTPRLEDLWAGTDEGATGLLADAVDLARSGQTARLGRLLAPMGVAYVVVPERLAPAPFATEELPPPRGVLATLAGQLDLEPLDVPAGLTVFRNQAFMPVRAELGEGRALPEEGGIVAALRLDLSDVPRALTGSDGYLRWSGPVEAGSTIYHSAAHSDHWSLSVEGDEAEAAKPFGWANAYEVPAGGEATLRFETPVLRYVVLGGQVVLWLWVLRALVRARFGSRRPPEGEPPGSLAVARSWAAHRRGVRR